MYRLIGKRAFDIFIVFITVILLSPVMILVFIMIKTLEPGPVIFKQQRIGRRGKMFLFYKFRSMPVGTGDIPSDRVCKIKLTWTGKMIRRTNLDELPQLLNILRGDMSVVGPRPPIPKQKELIDFRIKNGSIKIRPGLTGLAQINAFDGMSIAEKAEFDGVYSEDITFVNDIKIILSTLIYLLKPPPTY